MKDTITAKNRTHQQILRDHSMKIAGKTEPEVEKALHEQAKLIKQNAHNQIYRYNLAAEFHSKDKLFLDSNFTHHIICQESFSCDNIAR